jgi:hypothetical protein
MIHLSKKLQLQNNYCLKYRHFSGGRLNTKMIVYESMWFYTVLKVLLADKVDKVGTLLI